MKAARGFFYVSLSLVGLVFLCSSSSAAPGPGDIITIGTPPDAPARIAVVSLNPSTKELREVSDGGYLQVPFSIKVAPSGDIFVVNIAAGVGSVIHVDPWTGEQTMVSEGGLLASPGGVELDHSGQLIVTDGDALGGSGAVLGIDPSSGAQSVIASGDLILNPRGVAIDNDGGIFVTANSGIVRIDPANGMQHLVISRDSLRGVTGLTFDNLGDLYVCIVVIDGTERRNEVLRVDKDTGEQTLVASGEYLIPTQLQDIVALDDGRLLVTGQTRVGGAKIVYVDPITGAQELVFETPMGGVPGAVGGSTIDVFPDIPVQVQSSSWGKIKADRR